MKLLTRTSRYYLIWSSVTFLLAGIGFYFILRNLIHSSINETLLAEKTSVLEELEKNPTSYSYFHNLEIEAVQTRLPAMKQPIWSDTLIYHQADKEYIPYRQLMQIVQSQGRSYRVVMRESLIESDELIKAVFFSLLLLLAAMVGGLFWTNRFVTLRVWQPFWKTLSSLQTFQPGQSQTLSFPQTDIDEFSALNRALGELTHKVQQDYRSLKEFTENASHEAQTPLAVMRSEIELLLQSDEWSQTQLRSLRIINEQVNRLTRLHASLLLLAKIENGQFPAHNPVPLANLVGKRLEEWRAILDFKQIQVKTRLASAFAVPVHPLLADILIDNLLGNAVKHNHVLGKIQVEVSTEKLSIANTGPAFEGDPEQFFERFHKQRSAGDSTGLGLAIAKKICQAHGLALRYRIENGWHVLTISF